CGQRGAARNHGEAHVLRSLHDDQREGIPVAEPANNLIRFAVPDLAEGGKQAGGVQRGEIVEIVAVDALDPQPIPFGGARISHTDDHGREVSCHGLERSMNGSPSWATVPAPYAQKREARAGGPRPGLTHLSAQASNPKDGLLASRSFAGRSSRSGRRSGGIASRSSRRSGGIASRSSRRSGRIGGRGGGRRRRGGCGLGAGGFLLRAGRQHQRRNECAKSKFGFHRSVPRREARVVRKTM